MTHSYYCCAMKNTNNETKEQNYMPVHRMSYFPEVIFWFLIILIFMGSLQHGRLQLLHVIDVIILLITYLIFRTRKIDRWFYTYFIYFAFGIIADFYLFFNIAVVILDTVLIAFGTYGILSYFEHKNHNKQLAWLFLFILYIVIAIININLLVKNHLLGL